MAYLQKWNLFYFQIWAHKCCFKLNNMKASGEMIISQYFQNHIISFSFLSTFKMASNLNLMFTLVQQKVKWGGYIKRDKETQNQSLPFQWPYARACQIMVPNVTKLGRQK